MRKIVLSTAVAVVAALSYAAPSQAGDCAENVYNQRSCFIKKVKSYDAYGNLVVRKVRICK
ncbi:hypothetical protein [Pararhizobium antarcticum]|uniref:Uncharacterized protein n=1 Tax=Pararhizobium antarcticum TaxID=1798805 RepID=A0A657LMA9_9HYPH|nr:hypothetical protein [Pararhizobium antarcticum]OJF91890.1 hypothetical protein AX760_22860 [Pararhizobium antarcticum]OJF97968.1 hypothetical protein AX761_13280 [Rhizobium sp. 58]